MFAVHLCWTLSFQKSRQAKGQKLLDKVLYSISLEERKERRVANWGHCWPLVSVGAEVVPCPRP